jgi:4-amino-4-deoxy-L-arabinose transferase-like glycosyltransferase
LRFYQLPERAYVGWDQADSAWAAKGILLDNPVRLEGVPIKGNAAMFMGPLYYYLIAPFYFFTNFDMIASPIFAGVVSVISFLVFYVVTKKLFSTPIALVAFFLYTFSMSVIGADKAQAAYTLIPIISYAVFYFLYAFLQGNEKHILPLAAVIGFGFHIHFTTVFYLLILLLTLPFVPRTKKALFSCLLAIPLFLLFLSPMLYSAVFAKQHGANGILPYLNASYHGFHLTRVWQLAADAFISFQAIVQFPLIRPLIFFVFPLFAATLYATTAKSKRKAALLMLYLIALWIVVPWLVLATYTGELTDYYFSLPRNLGIAMLAFLIVAGFTRTAIAGKALIIGLLLLFAGYNISLFNNVFPGNYLAIKQEAENAIRMKKKMPFKDRDPLYYMYYVSAMYPKK